jgi:hypothetical protein
MQQFPPIKFASPTRVASSFDHPDWMFKVEAANAGLEIDLSLYRGRL